MKTIPKGPFLGINNRRPDFDLRTESGDFVRDAVNVDLNNAGRFSRRKASELVQAMTSPHSLYMTSSTTGYLVRSGTMYAITLPAYTETLFKVLSNNNQVHWLEDNGDLYYSNGTDSGRVSAGVWYPIALPTPAAPSPSSLPAGSLFAGSYRVALSYYNAATGEEGGISPSANYALAADGGLRVTLPAATAGATHVNVYCSTVNGKHPMFCASVALGTATYDIVAPGSGREANQRYESPLPPGKLFLFNGCLCSYSGKNVYEGIPSRPGYYLPSEGRIPFKADVSNCVPAQNGIYIVSDKTYWIPGTRITTAEGTIQDVLPYGGVPKTEFEVPNKSLYGWFGEEGFVLATPGGEVQAVMSDNVKLTPPAYGLSAVLESQDYRRVVGCGWCLNLDTKSATRYEGYDFSSISRGYGTMSDGLYSIEGGSADVPWVIDLGKENFGTEEKKKLPAAYLGCSSERPIKLRIRTPKDDYTYVARSCSDELQEHRVDPGKGLEASWYGLSLEEDCDFTLATASFAPFASHRRI